jgi:uncharacterized protein (DUF433 family)
VPSKTFRTVFGYNEIVRILKPTRKLGQSLRDLPTYSIPEAAAVLAIPPRTLSYWFSGAHRIFQPAGEYRTHSLLSFKDIAEAYMLYVLRHVHNLSAQSLRDSLLNLRKETKRSHPLFDLDIQVFSRDLLLDIPPRGKRGRQVVNLSQNRQLALGEVIDIFKKRILKDSQGHTLRVFPWRYFTEDNSARPVSIDPEVLSGRLVVTGTRIPVSVLLGMKESQRTTQQIAENYGLDIDTVEKALRHVGKPLQKVA